jgi:DNA polymerase-3 subunit delta'
VRGGKILAGFKDIVGHVQVIEHLKNAILLDKVSHAYIINGEKGSGKKTLAEAFAMTLQCKEGKAEPCGECHSCRQVLSHNQPDIIWVTHEKPGSIGVEDIRQQLNGDIQIKPYSSRYKIYIVDEAEKLTVQAQNALLKTIEEPPPYGIILLLTTNANLLLPTILSRCILLNLHFIDEEVIREYLMKHLEVPDYRAKFCAAFSAGNVGRAVELATSESFGQMKNEAVKLMKYIDDMEIYEIIGAIKNITNYKAAIEDYLDMILLWYRDVLMFKVTLEADMLIFKEELQEVKRMADKKSYINIENIIHAIEKVKIRLKANVNTDLALELMLLTIKEN